MIKKRKMAHFNYGESEEEKIARYSTNSQILQELVERSDSKLVHIKIACNHYTNKETLSKLSYSKHDIVRRYVAENHNISLKTAFHLAFDPVIGVKEALAKRTSYKIVQDILYDTNRDNNCIVTNILKRTKNNAIIDDFLNSNSMDVATFIKILNEMLYNDSLDEKQLKKIINILISLNVSLNVSCILAHPRCNEDIQALLK